MTRALYVSIVFLAFSAASSAQQPAETNVWAEYYRALDAYNKSVQARDEAERERMRLYLEALDRHAKHEKDRAEAIAAIAKSSEENHLKYLASLQEYGRTLDQLLVANAKFERLEPSVPSKRGEFQALLKTHEQALGKLEGDLKRERDEARKEGDEVTAKRREELANEARRSREETLAKLDRPPARPPEAPKPAPPGLVVAVPPAQTERSLADKFEADGVRALVGREYKSAVDSFRDAHSAEPGDRRLKIMEAADDLEHAHQLANEGTAAVDVQGRVRCERAIQALDRRFGQGREKLDIEGVVFDVSDVRARAERCRPRLAGPAALTR